MTRFFVRPEQRQADLAILDAADAHHLRIVLKARSGDPVTILDGTGSEWPGVIDEISKSSVTVRLGAEIVSQTEPKTRVTVAQALPKISEKLEDVLQHGTEIGAAAFRVFQSTRSQTHLTGERQAKRLTRWQVIIKTAAEQSHRAMLPSVCADPSLGDVLAHAHDFDLALLADPNMADASLRDVLMAPRPVPLSILVVVGPESGFTEAEVSQARRAGLAAISLGPRILRTETAAFVMLSQILYALE